MQRKNMWKEYTEIQQKELEELSVRYKECLDIGKTERECVKLGKKMADTWGYKNLEDCISEGTTLKAGDKVYADCMGKAFVMFQLGKKPLEEGMNILGAHIDSPRIDVKQNPLYEDSDMAYLDTHYYGGIKKYQWVTLPLAIHGVVVKKNGETVDICIGEKEDDPVFCVTDLLIHLAGTQMEKKAAKTGAKALMTTFSVYNLERNNAFDYSKAEKELGYHTRSYAETLHDEAVWLRAEGKIA